MGGFEIKCLKCNSTDVEIEEDIEWINDEEDEIPICIGCSVRCNSCNNSSSIENL